MLTVYYGTIVHMKAIDNLESFKNGFIAVDERGKIVAIGDKYEEWLQSPEIKSQKIHAVRLSDFQFIMPGFVDCHIHAPQYAQIGLGLDMPLLDWLNTYTFPLEAKFSDINFAKEIYKNVIEATIRCGTTLASYFATNHLESTLILAREAIDQGQRALIGKVCSNCNSPDFYVETTEESVGATKQFVESMQALKSDLVLPTITPRFALSCNKELLADLGKIAKSNDLHIQSHISENLDEVKVVRGIFGTSYAKAYDNAGLLGNKTVMAHGVHLDDDEIVLFKERGTSVAHCPTSNTNLNSGICDVRRLIDGGVTVGLGTDVSGGNSVSIKHALLRALEVSKHLDFFKKLNISGTGRAQNPDENYQQLKYKEGLYLATLGGAKALALDHITGNFVVGKDFDALLVDISVLDTPKRILTVDEKIEKFLYACDDRNIIAVYVAGKQIKSKGEQCTST